MNQKSVRLTSTLTALSALAAAVVAIVAVNSSGLLSAQSTSETKIDLLNVGMCVTTDDSVFKEADCDDGDGNDEFNVGDRDEIVEREKVHVTYAHDPTNRGDSVRAIVTNSDVLKISITDPGRDRRRTVLYPVDGFEELLVDSDDTNNSRQEALLERIQSLLGDRVEDEDALEDFENTDINVKVLDPENPTDKSATISQSGNSTLLFYRDTGGDSSDKFRPLSVARDAQRDWIDEVQWYGYVVDTTSPPGSFNKDYVLQNVSGLVNFGRRGSGNLIADEDRTSGSDNIAPWMVVQANVAPNTEFRIVAVAYETSDREIITGGDLCLVKYSESEAEGHTDINADDCKPNSQQYDPDTTGATTQPNYSRSELSGEGEALVAEVEGADGEALWLSLKETAPFTGTYVGYVRVTDANGDGPRIRSRDEDDGSLTWLTSTGATTTSPSRSNWGLRQKDADKAENDDDPVITDAAVVGVSGRLKITYTFFEGNQEEERVNIDVAPPVIDVTSPIDGASDDDRSPDFIGTIGDTGSGLAEDTFRLYVDNKADESLSKPGSRSEDRTYVLDIPSGINTSATALTSATDYEGYTTNPTFGILSGNRDSGSLIYYDEEGDDLVASLTSNDAAYKFILAEDYEDGDNDATFDDDARIEGVRTKGETIAGHEIEVDFQALVLDLAGNIGFSDADPDRSRSSRLIDDLGRKPADRLDNGENGRRPNVLGYFSRHVFLLDDKDPEFDADYPALTGFYGLNSDDEPVRHQRGVMITFDGDVSEDTITANTFTVELDDKSSATVDDVIVEGNQVFLRLTEDLKTSETPKIGLASGHRVEDLAGNQLHSREVSEAVEAHDGLPPTLTVTLSGGTGTGEGAESSSGLTNEEIVVTVESDEDLRVAHYVVLCPNFRYKVTDPDTNRMVNQDEDDFVLARTGSLVGGKPDIPTPTHCQEDPSSSVRAPDVSTIENGMTRVGQKDDLWRDTWEDSSVDDGELTVVVYARDKSEYRLDPLDEDSNDAENWSAVTAKFTLDTVLKALVVRNEIESGEVLPEPGDEVSENRPYMILRFTDDSSTVSLQKMLVDGRDVTARVDSNLKNEFIYVPDELDRGTHKVEVDAIDSAGNETTFRYEFEVVSRSAFQVRLYAGWNAISLPQEPIDGSLGSVFKNSAIDQVISFERISSDEDPEWAMATRRDGVWEYTYGDPPLTNIKAGLGYWVHTSEFVTERVLLRGPDRGRPDSPLTPIGIKTGPGWNFVGVVDQDGDQTEGSTPWREDYFLEVTRNGVTAKEAQTGTKYLGDYVQAYTWDASRSNFRVLEEGNPVKIGDGIWVFYGEGVAP